MEDPGEQRNRKLPLESENCHPRAAWSAAIADLEAGKCVGHIAPRKLLWVCKDLQITWLLPLFCLQILYKFLSLANSKLEQYRDEDKDKRSF